MCNTDNIKELIQLLSDRNIKISTAESLTGGMIGDSIVSVAGASAVFEGGAITYSETAKINLLGVKKDTVDKYTVVSAKCAEEMALGSAVKFGTDIAVSATGIAGPDGGSDVFPVGLVYIGLYFKNKTNAFKYIFKGDRQAVREASVDAAISVAVNILKESK